MSKNLTVHNGTLHLSMEMSQKLGEMAKRGKVATISNTLRSEDDSLSIGDSRDLAKSMVDNPGGTSYHLNQ